jgi:LL-diaminopimelate aminotransferase
MISAQRMDLFASHFFAAAGESIARLQAEGKDVIRLDVGSPDLPPAGHIVTALARSAAYPDHHGYQPHSATPGYRAAWAEMYRRVHGVELDPDREIVPLLGSKEGIFHMASACVNPGEVVLIPDPGYITYIRGAQMAGGEPYYMPLKPERGYLPDLDAIPEAVARRARLLWLNYPNNPTAATAPLEFFAEAVEFARRYRLLVCHDAAYSQVTFNGHPARSILEAPGAKEVAVEFNTLSKSHNMAGWRVGAAVGNPQALRALYTLKTNLDSGHFLPVLEAAEAAMTGDQSWLAQRNEVYRQRRDIVLPALRSLGLQAETPQASLYVWSTIPPGVTSTLFVSEVLENVYVSLTPGTVFGERGEGYFRLALTASTERVAEAIAAFEAVF